MSALTESEARHLLRRASFGAIPAEVARFVGLERAEAAKRLLGWSPKKKRLGSGSIERMQGRWFKLMLASRTPPLQERLVLFFHDHFATSNVGVGYPKLMSNQIGLLRLHAKGNFRTFVKEMNRDAAMIEWLDTQRNSKSIPNENYARELLELFTLGVGDLNGNPNYVQDDIVQIARAFTGWRRDDTGRTFLVGSEHDYQDDYPERGAKVVFRETGGFGASGRSFADQGEGAQEIDRVIDHIFDHEDTSGRKTVARRLVWRLLQYFTHAGYADAATAAPVIDDLLDASGFESSFEIEPLVQALLVHDAFYETAVVAPFSSSTPKSMSWPVDYMVSAMRLLGVYPKGSYTILYGGDYQPVWIHSRNMGQSLLEPPSVFGWDWEQAWATSGTMLARHRFARDLTTARHASGKAAFRPETLVDLGLTAAGDIVAAVIEACGVKGLFTAEEIGILVNYLNDADQSETPDPDANVDLNDHDTRNRKLNGLFALVLESPAFQVR